MHANYMYEGGVSYQNQHLFSILTDFSLKLKYCNIIFILLFEYNIAIYIDIILKLNFPDIYIG